VILRNRLQPSAKFYLLKDYKTVVLGDREFCSVKLGNWLRQKQVYFCLRLKKKICAAKDDIWLQLEALGLWNGVVSEWVSVTKQKGFAKFNVLASGNVNIGSRPQMRVVYFDQFVRLRVSYPGLQNRFGIEEMCARFQRWWL